MPTVRLYLHSVDVSKPANKAVERDENSDPFVDTKDFSGLASTSFLHKAASSRSRLAVISITNCLHSRSNSISYPEIIFSSELLLCLIHISNFS